MGFLENIMTGGEWDKNRARAIEKERLAAQALATQRQQEQMLNDQKLQQGLKQQLAVGAMPQDQQDQYYRQQAGVVESQDAKIKRLTAVADQIAKLGLMGTTETGNRMVNESGIFGGLSQPTKAVTSPIWPRPVNVPQTDQQWTKEKPSFADRLTKWQTKTAPNGDLITFDPTNPMGTTKVLIPFAMNPMQKAQLIKVYSDAGNVDIAPEYLAGLATEAGVMQGGQPAVLTTQPMPTPGGAISQPSSQEPVAQAPVLTGQQVFQKKPEKETMVSLMQKASQGDAKSQAALDTMRTEKVNTAKQTKEATATPKVDMTKQKEIRGYLDIYNGLNDIQPLLKPNQNETGPVAGRLNEAKRSWGETPVVGELMGGMPKAQFSQLYVSAKNLADILARARTGAAINPTEIDLYNSLMPSTNKPYDTNVNDFMTFRNLVIKQLASRGYDANNPPGPDTISTKEEYDALPEGTKYIGPDGKPAIKGTKK